MLSGDDFISDELVGTQAVNQFESVVKGSEDSQDSDQMARNKDALRSLFTSLMKSSPESIEARIDSLLACRLTRGEGRLR
jgi:mannose-6-phosphate isomerase